jgi:short-subunit dehydrogenase
MDLTGRRVLLTGASGGLGDAIARAIAAQRPAELLLTGRRADRLEPLAAATNGRAIQCDLGDPDEVARLAAAASGVDVLVSNAALPASGSLESFSEAEIDRAIAVNLRAPMVLAHRLAPAMQAAGAGRLVFISSLAGKVGSPGGSVYSATKFGLRGFAQALREDLRGTGVGVTCVFPGFVRGAGMLADSGAQLPFFVSTSTPAQVAAAVLRAIDGNRGEIDVAPFPMGAAARFAGAAPGVVTAVQRALGARRVSAALAAGQRDKRW